MRNPPVSALPAALRPSTAVRWLGAVALALFTVAATLLANRFWQVPPAERGMVMNGFFEHLGLAGALVYVAWNDLRSRQ